MNDNLPEINFGKKPEKKRGMLGWLRGLGTGSRGAIGAMGGSSSSGFAGLGGLLAGKLSTIVTIAMIATAGGVYVAHNSPSPLVSSGSFSSDKRAGSNYVPGIVRSEQANQGSSLAMFTDTNKGSGLSLDENAQAKAAANTGDKTGDQAAAAKDEAKPEEPKAPDAQAMAQGMMGQAGGTGSGSLTNSIGGSGSGKFAMMGRPGQSAMAGNGKGGLSGGVGNGFQAMPKFNERKGKLMAMKGAARPVTANSSAAKHSSVGKGAWNQSKALRGVQKNYSGTNADTLRYTQDKAWNGTTAGATTEGAGLGEGGDGAGIVTSPSLDNASDGSSGGGNNNGNVVIPECTGTPTECAEHEKTKWEDLANQAEEYILYACLCAVIGGILIQAAEDATGSVVGNIGLSEALYALGYAVLALGAYFAGMAMYDAISLLCDPYNKYVLGTIYTCGAGCALTALGFAAFGDMEAGLNVPMLWLAGIAGVLDLGGTICKAAGVDK